MLALSFILHVVKMFNLFLYHNFCLFFVLHVISNNFPFARSPYVIEGYHAYCFSALIYSSNNFLQVVFTYVSTLILFHFISTFHRNLPSSCLVSEYHRRTPRILPFLHQPRSHPLNKVVIARLSSPSNQKVLDIRRVLSG